MITKEESAQLKKLIKNYTKAFVADSWSGSLMPEEKHQVKINEAKARRELNEFIRNLDGSSQRIGS